ncbi:MAG TPA: hypothetical protein VLG11_00630 [Candidatus Saccharimonadales bacterium]|nr:hypothetical protein [Candidatus Saccharimonadales bacterium]
MKYQLSSPRSLTALFLATLLIALNSITLVQVSAGALSPSYIRLNRMSAGTTTSFRVVFKTASAGATSVAVNFNGADTTTWTGSSGLVAASQTASSATCAADTGATALPGTLAASGAAATVTITGVTALSASTSYCVDLTSATAVTNAAAAEYHPTITAGSDTTTVAVRTITNDQVAVTATVAPTFNFVLSANSDSFTSSLGSGAVTSTAGISTTINTNAKSGWYIWAKDANTGLTSPSQSKTIAGITPGTATSLSAGTEGYVFALTAITQGSGAGTATPAAAYDGTASGGANSNGSGLDGTIRQVASSTGTANGAGLTFKERAAVSPITPAATDYADTITLIGAGSF